MGRSENYLQEYIDLYIEGVIPDDVFVTTLVDWDYEEQGSNSSPWECDAPYVAGSWDDVQLGFDRGVIPEYIFYQICDRMDARESNGESN